MFSHKLSALLFAILFITTLAAAHGTEGRCGHDDQVFDIKKQEVEEDMSSLSAGRTLQSSEYSNLRTVINYELLRRGPTTYANYIQYELAPPAFNYISGAIRVKYPVSGLLKVTNEYSICGVNVPSDLRAGVEADFYYMLDVYTDTSSTVASSMACTQAAGTNRPLTAYTKINLNMFEVANGDVLIQEKNNYLLIHEIFHTLGISTSLFPYYINSYGVQLSGHIQTQNFAGVTQMVIDVAPVTQLLQEYYGCTSVRGIIMENDGSTGTSGSHLERKYFPYEVISSGDIFGRRISKFSLALLEGSGWYSPNYNFAEPYYFGQGLGCSFLNYECSYSGSSFPEEFCTGSFRGCSAAGRSGGYCGPDSKANGCEFVIPQEDFDCDNPDGVDYARFPSLETYGRGLNAKCFEGTLNTRYSSNGATSFCFKYTCVGSGSSTELQVNIGSEAVTCKEAGSVSVNGYYGNIVCPDPIQFCSTVGLKYCPRGCMNRGTCLNDVCVCEEGYSGIDCGLIA